MKTKLHIRLISLAEKVDSIELAVYRGEDGKFYTKDGKPAGAGDFKTVAGAVGTTAAVGAGYAGHRAIMKAGGGDQILGKGAAAQAYRNVARNTAAQASGAVADGLENVGKRIKRASRVQERVSVGGMNAAGGAYRNVGGVGSFGKSLKMAGAALLRKPMRFDSSERLIFLAEKVDSIELSSGSRTASELLKVRMAPVRINKTMHGEFKVSPTRKLIPESGKREAISVYESDIKSARSTAASMAKGFRRNPV